MALDHIISAYIIDVHEYCRSCIFKTNRPWAGTLSWQHMTYKPSKLGQSDLVFGSRLEFIRRSVHARLQVSHMHRL